jgi:type IV secretion system protein VirB5
MVAALATRATAQIPVVDGTNAMNMVRELQQGVQQIQQLQSQLQQLQQVYYSISHVTDLGTAVGALSSLGIQNPLPVNPYAASNLLQGTGNAQGMLGSLSSLFTNTSNTNTIFKAPGDGFGATELNANGSGIAGAQSMAMQLYQSAGQRVGLLGQLQALINDAPDQSTREALLARISVEQAYVQNQQVQAQTLGNYMQAEMDSRQQRDAERVQKDMSGTISTLQREGLLN